MNLCCTPSREDKPLQISLKYLKEKNWRERFLSNEWFDMTVSVV
jgi:hypothetical protein